MLKAKLTRYIPLETADIFFSTKAYISNRVLARSMPLLISFVGAYNVHELQGAKNKNCKMKKSCPQRDSNSRPLNHKATTVNILLSNMIYYRQILIYTILLCSVFIVSCNQYCYYIIWVWFCCLTSRYCLYKCI